MGGTEAAGGGEAAEGKEAAGGGEAVEGGKAAGVGEAAEAGAMASVAPPASLAGASGVGALVPDKSLNPRPTDSSSDGGPVEGAGGGS